MHTLVKCGYVSRRYWRQTRMKKSKVLIIIGSVAICILIIMYIIVNNTPLKDDKESIIGGLKHNYNTFKRVATMMERDPDYFYCYFDKYISSPKPITQFDQFNGDIIQLRNGLQILHIKNLGFYAVFESEDSIIFIKQSYHNGEYGLMYSKDNKVIADGTDSWGRTTTHIKGNWYYYIVERRQF